MPRAKKEALTKICLHCLNEFSTTRSTSKYCSRDCKEKHSLVLSKEKTSKRRQLRLQSKEQLFDKSNFARYLVDEVKRAGTLEILRGITSEQLLQLLQLTRDRTRFSGIVSGLPSSKFHLSHIYAVKGKDRIGLLSPDNLVITPADYNHRRGNKSPDLDNPEKYSIAVTSLDKKHFVSDSEPISTIILRIKRYLSSSVLEPYYKKAKQTKTQYNIFRDKLLKLGYSEQDIKHLKKERLQEHLLSEGIKTSSTFSRESYSAIEVCKKELERKNQTGSDLYLICEALVSQRYDFNNDIAWSLDYPLNKFTDFVVEQVNNLLHLEQYKLDIEGRALMLFFSIRENATPSNKLEEELLNRKQFTDGGKLYYDYNNLF